MVPSVKTLRFPLSAEFSSHCVLNFGNPCHVLPCYQSEEMKILVNKLLFFCNVTAIGSIMMYLKSGNRIHNRHFFSNMHAPLRHYLNVPYLHYGWN